jgi:hypothetical protein
MPGGDVSRREPEALGLLCVDMHVLRSGVGFVGRLGFGLLVLGAMSKPLQDGTVSPSSIRAATLVPPATVPLANQAVQEWSVQIDEATLTREANAWAMEQPLLQTAVGTVRLQELSVQPRDDQLVVHGTAEAGWIRAPFDVTASASVDAGHVQVQVPDAHVNGLDLPDAARRDIERQLQDWLDGLVLEHHASVRSVRLGQGTLLVTGTRQ